MQIKLKLHLTSYRGKMNTEILKLLESPEYKNQFVLHVDLNQTENPDTWPDIWIDFSKTENLERVLDTCCSRKIPLVICTTGYNQEEMQKIHEAAQSIPLLYAANTSLSMNALMFYLKGLADALTGYAEIGITDIHHKHKKDSPSGTALALAKVIGESQTSSKNNQALPISSLRLGEVVGEHAILFTMPHESIEIKHVAHSKAMFAAGALQAAAWLANPDSNKKPGLYNMQQVLGFNK